MELLVKALAPQAEGLGVRIPSATDFGHENK